MNTNERWEHVYLTEVIVKTPLSNPDQVLQFTFVDGNEIKYFKYYGKIAALKLFFQNTFRVSEHEIRTFDVEELCTALMARNRDKHFVVYVTFKAAQAGPEMYQHITTVAPVL